MTTDQICDRECTSGCHADDCEHHGHLPPHAAIEVPQPAPPLHNDGANPIASTNYGGWVEVECCQMCGWKPADQRSSEAVKHTKATGHETAVKHHSSIHYHVRSDRTGEPS